MQVQVEQRTEGEVGLKISVAPEVVNAEVEQVFKEAASSVQVPGFRPGKAPRSMIESRINLDLVRGEALERLTHTAYLEALEETDLEPIDRARIEDDNLAEDGSFSFTAIVAVMPPVKLGEYKGIAVTQPQVQVTDEAVEEELNRQRGRFMSYTSLPDHPIVAGDIAIIDYAMEVAGQPVDEAAVSGYPLEVGKDELFPQLNEGLLGAKSGEERRIDSKLPDSYTNSELAGKTATFVVAVKDVKTVAMPELNDEFAQRYAGINTLDELRQEMRKSLEKITAHMVEDTVRERVLSQVIEAAEVELPPLMIERYKKNREAEATDELERQGLNLDEMLTQHGLTHETWQQNLEGEARRSLKRYLVLREIAKQEGVLVTEAELKEEIERLAQMDRMSYATKRRELETNDLIDDIAGRFQREKVVRLLIEAAEITPEEPVGETAPVAEAAPATEETPAEESQTEDTEHGKE